jgi:toxin ParE1/3/4
LKLVWSGRGLADLVEIGRYIARDNPAAARRFVARLQESARKVPSVPRAGRVVPEFQIESVREVLLGNYRIVYRLGAKTIEVLTVFEGHRLLPLSSAEVEP